MENQGHAIGEGMNLAWTETPPNRLGYYWLRRGPTEAIVNVLPRRAFGNRLCALSIPQDGGNRVWTPVDEFADGTETVMWAGPIQPPAEK